MKFHICGRWSAEDPDINNGVAKENHIWISAVDPYNEVKLPYNSFRLNHLTQYFDDIDDSLDGKSVGVLGEKKRKLECMKQDYADNIVAFVSLYKDEVDLIVVNCEAGISRSSAIAWSLSQWLNGHDSGISSNTLYWPNQYVKKLMDESIKLLNPKTR